MSEKIKILVVCHQQTALPHDESGVLFPIQCGAALSNSHLNMQRDDECMNRSCENISTKNPYYCELTAMFWAYKNIRKIYPNIEFIGLNHYRRYFAYDESQPHPVFNRPLSLLENYRVNEVKIMDFLTKYDAIISKPHIGRTRLYDAYAKAHNIKDLDDTLSIIKAQDKDMYKDAIKIINKGCDFATWNMFIMKIEAFEKYCEWLFGVLFELEKRIQGRVESYDTYQKRVYGFLAERLFTLYALSGRLGSCKRLNIYYYNNEFKKHTPVYKQGFHHAKNIVLRNIRSAFGRL